MKKVIIGMIIGAICAGGGIASAFAIGPCIENHVNEEIERQAIEMAMADLDSEFDKMDAPYEMRMQVKELVCYQITSEHPLSDEEYQKALVAIYNTDYHTYG